MIQMRPDPKWRAEQLIAMPLCDATKPINGSSKRIMSSYYREPRMVVMDGRRAVQTCTETIRRSGTVRDGAGVPRATDRASALDALNVKRLNMRRYYLEGVGNGMTHVLGLCLVVGVRCMRSHPATRARLHDKTS